MRGQITGKSWQRQQRGNFVLLPARAVRKLLQDSKTLKSRDSLITKAFIGIYPDNIIENTKVEIFLAVSAKVDRLICKPIRYDISSCLLTMAHLSVQIYIYLRSESILSLLRVFLKIRRSFVRFHHEHIYILASRIDLRTSRAAHLTRDDLCTLSFSPLSPTPLTVKPSSSVANIRDTCSVLTVADSNPSQALRSCEPSPEYI